LDSQDVAVTLYESENFILDLPFLECVLPSMQAREHYFVPVFIQKVLLPFWNSGQGAFTDLENVILSLSREHFFHALSGYLELVFLAAILDAPLEDKHTFALGRKASRFVDIIRGFFGVRPNFFEGSQTLANLRARLARVLPRIPSLLMIGQQWGFDARQVATNIKRLDCLDPAYLEGMHLPYNRDIDAFLDAVINGILLPNLPASVTVSWVAWTMSPDFTCSFDRDTGEQIMLPRLRYDFAGAFARPASSTPLRQRKQSLKSILKVLEIREMRRKPEYVPFLPITRAEIEESNGVTAERASSSSAPKKKAPSAKKAQGTRSSGKAAKGKGSPDPKPISPEMVGSPPSDLDKPTPVSTLSSEPRHFLQPSSIPRPPEHRPRCIGEAAVAKATILPCPPSRHSTGQASRMISVPVNHYRRPMPEAPKPLIVNPDALKPNVQEFPRSPIPCLSGFEDDPLDMFNPDVVRANPWGDDHSFGLQKPSAPDVFDFIYDYCYYHEQQ
jgi:hypothetical protein